MSRIGSFIGACKVLSRVIPGCSVYLAPLDDTTAGSQSQEPISWTDELRSSFSKAQRGLSTCRTITLPKPDDHVWIATNGAVRKPDIRATLYVTSIATSSLAGFLSVKLRVAQITWLLCEVKALSIAAAAKHFSPSIVQSNKTPVSSLIKKPCVQAYEKLSHRKFSASPLVLTFLFVVSRY